MATTYAMGIGPFKPDELTCTPDGQAALFVFDRSASATTDDATRALFAQTVASEVTEVHVKGVDVRGKKVVVIEDIVDTGGTLVALCEKLKSAGAKEVHCATLLNKEARRKKEHAEKLEKMLEKTYVGLECEDEFVVGYGLDYKGKYRCLPYIGVLKEDAINGTL